MQEVLPEFRHAKTSFLLTFYLLLYYGHGEEPVRLQNKPLPVKSNKNKRNVKKNLQWFAVYVKARFERKVLAALEQKEIECYLPLRKEVRQWSDRKKEVEEPLIRGYLFVYIDIRFYYDVLVVPGVIKFVSFDQKPAVIPEYQIDDLKIFLRDGGRHVEVTNEYVQKGQLVRVCEGPFLDAIGEIVELRGKKRILMRVRALGCVIHAELGANQIELLPPDSQQNV